ncbi:MAG: hypothetical protein WC054_02305 [Candidatus Nanopelagicales bacterium]
MAARAWTSSEIDTLRKHSHRGATWLAAILDRSTASVKRAAHTHRISLRQKGSRRGLLLGQPRDATLIELRQAARDPAALGQLLQAQRDGTIPPEIITQAQQIALRELPLCPACTRNHANHKQTGLCRACYLRGLAAAHQAHLDAQDAQRDLWTARQQAKRAKDKATE